MCGISGVLRIDGRAVNPDVLDAMASRLSHRGPDGHGRWTAGPAGLSHRRLSIIDLGGSHQPMEDSSGLLHLSFNGEIFNYRQLRAGLNYPFTTDGDTEVLLAALQRRGTGALTELRGQFAFALHDGRDGSVLLARDRFGVLPLFYYLDEDQLAFASEIKALLPALPHRPDIDRLALDAYLSGSSTPAPLTLLRGVRKLRPGHFLRVGADGDACEERYWSLPPAGDRLDVTPDVAVDLVHGALREAVASALVADVPVGAYLSGGVDSSLIVALIREAHEGQVQTFSAGFSGAPDDELPIARQVSRMLGTAHHEVVVSPSDFQDLWHTLSAYRDAPVSQPADVAVFRLAQLARRTVKVVLSGEGSDELFAGYPKHRAARATEVAATLPAGLRRRLSCGVEALVPRRYNRLRVPVRVWGEATQEDRFRTWFAPFTTVERRRLLGDGPSFHVPDAPADGDLVRRMLQRDCGSWLSDNLLERGDRMSMAASLELRPPFLDHAVAELAFRLPTSVKLRDGRGKWVVKQVARRYLPAEIVDRRKVGFRVPLDRWFRDDLSAMARDLLLDPGSFVASALDNTAVRQLVGRHISGRSDESARLWNLLSLEVWHEAWTRSTSTAVGLTA